MDYIYAILIAVPIGLVAFLSAFWGGIYRCLCFSEILKMASAFVIFQAGLFWLGTWTGNSFANSIGWLSIPFAETIILLTGVKLIYTGFRTRPEQKSYNLAKNGELIAVSFASSLNAFMAGLGIGLLRPVTNHMIIGIVLSVALFSYIGVYVGKSQGRIIYTTFVAVIAGIFMLTLAVILAMDLYNFI
jgi:putative Mn2+ efflux pump MntP